MEWAMNFVSKTAEDQCWDKQLISKYDIAGPRYTSYPTAPQFNSDFSSRDYQGEVTGAMRDSITPLSLYVHIPFCENICYYCACNKIVTTDHSVSRRYLDHLATEMQLQSKLLGKRRKVSQLHLGGGTPTFFDAAELTELVHLLASNFNLSDDPGREYSIEIDPRTVNEGSLALLKGLGFNRLSLGIQDFDEQVQVAINRRQRLPMVQSLTNAARNYGFKSISFDLIYGLPMQSPASLSRTLEQLVQLSPDRIAYYNYAHLPERFTSQRAIARQQLPSAAEKIDMLELIARSLKNAGYRHIGMDHFAKPEDDLSIAQSRGTLRRNFQGYSTCLAPDLIGFGVSAISSLRNSFSQNEKELSSYYEKLDGGELAIAKGLRLTPDDHIRSAVISQIICNLQLSIELIEQEFAIVFPEYFARELVALRAMESDGLVRWESATLVVTERGRIMLRNICMCFDKYQQQPSATVFSKSL